MGAGARSALENRGTLLPAASLSFEVLGVRVDAVQIPDTVVRMEEWIARRDICRFVAVTDMHSVMEAQHDSRFKGMLARADLVVPDGFPLVWLGRRKGFALRSRVCGPELMAAFCEQTARKEYRHFFYGGAPGVAEDLAARFTARFTGLVVAGTYCPPFRALTPEEDCEAVAVIERSRADVVWVGLGAPKQERWMFEHRGRLNVPVLIGVGAAFDFHTGRIPRAPGWVRDYGFEWLFRLAMEPRRLWKRYLVYGSEFILLVALESMGLKKFS
jgi:N-acetylglucosaminyldiphosphoundecaprenol N-acetyl-beta-D-mannosaminyltransferase